MSQGCVTMSLFKRKFALKSVIEGSKNGYHRRDTFHRRGDVVATIYAVGFAVLGFGLATLAVFYYLGAFWGVAWLAFCVFLLSYLNKNDTKNG